MYRLNPSEVASVLCGLRAYADSMDRASEQLTIEQLRRDAKHYAEQSRALAERISSGWLYLSRAAAGAQEEGRDDE